MGMAVGCYAVYSCAYGCHRRRCMCCRARRQWRYGCPCSRIRIVIASAGVYYCGCGAPGTSPPAWDQ
eukprot:scaffold7789_cov376-Prasinococcus_capsulatus_cf.AAC.3